MDLDDNPEPVNIESFTNQYAPTKSHSVLGFSEKVDHLPPVASTTPLENQNSAGNALVGQLPLELDGPSQTEGSLQVSPPISPPLIVDSRAGNHGAELAPDARMPVLLQPEISSTDQLLVMKNEFSPGDSEEFTSVLGKRPLDTFNEGCISPHNLSRSTFGPTGYC